MYARNHAKQMEYTDNQDTAWPSLTLQSPERVITYSGTVCERGLRKITES